MRNVRMTIWLLVVVGNAQAAIVEWPVSEGGNGHSYEAVFGSVTWTEARDGAYAAGGSLVSIESAEENAFVFSLIEHTSYWWTLQDSAKMGPWLGGFQPEGSAEPDGGWQWLSSEPFGYTNWADGQPSNTKDEEHYLHFFGTESRIMPTWNDVEESYYTMNGYVAEYVPEPTTLLLLGMGGLMLRRRRVL